MNKFTPEFIASELALAAKATPGPIVMEWDYLYGTPGVWAWSAMPCHKGEKLADVEPLANNDRLYSESAYNNYPAALAEIQRLQEKLDAAEKELKDAKSFHPRAMKLIIKRKNFVVVAVDEPYFVDVYKTIRSNEIKAGRWTEEDEIQYQNTLWS